MRTRMFLVVLLPLCLAAPFDDIANYDHSDVSQVKFNEQLRLLFKIMDIDQNRLIDAEELMLICLENDIDLPSTEAERIVTHPGLLTMDKFVELLADCPSDKTEDILLYLVHAGGNGDRRERMQGFFKNLKSKFMEQITANKNKLFGKKNIGTTMAPTSKAPTTVAPTTKAPTTVAPTTKAPSSTAPPEAPKQEGESCGRVTPTHSRGDCAEGLTCVPGRAPGAPGICTLPVSCSGGATSLSTSDHHDMVLCKDKTHQTCEKDFESLCPAGWKLCHPAQFNNRNHGWNYNWKEAKAGNPLGVIYCDGTGSGWAGHYGIDDSNPVLNTDQQLNCWGAGSSRPGCELFKGRWDCNNKQMSALCCAPTKTCGDGVVQEEEDCDDGNDDDMDECFNTCTWKNPKKHGLSGCD